jgi:acyl dehydratase
MSVRADAVAEFNSITNWDMSSASVSPLFALLASTAPLLRKDELFDSPWGRTLHGDHSIELSRKLVVGDVLTTTARVLGREISSAGDLVRIEMLSTDSDSQPCARQVATIVVRDPRRDGWASSTNASRVRSTEFRRLTALEIPSDLPLRYAALSGDANLIHVDEPMARALGFRTIIMQGLCTMAVVMSPVLALERDNAIQITTARMRRPVHPGERLDVFIRERSDAIEVEVFNASGSLVLTGAVGA